MGDEHWGMFDEKRSGDNCGLGGRPATAGRPGWLGPAAGKEEVPQLPGRVVPAGPPAYDTELPGPVSLLVVCHHTHTHTHIRTY